MKRYLISLLLLASGLLPAAIQPPVVHHRLEVEVDPATSTLRLEDHVELPQARDHLEFILHQGLQPELKAPQGRLILLGSVPAAVPASRYRIELEKPARSLTLKAGGRISHPPKNERDGRGGTPGTISPQGIYLADSTLWYPRIGENLVTFSLQLELPEGWQGVSQGAPLDRGAGWQELNPQDEIYLVAAPFHRYRQDFNGIAAMVWLRRADEALARRYLQATEHYIGLYQRLIGPYPYAKFALVENFWESGYGMPSFTLLGPTVIRLPFILHSSYPHEILHNWWGNSVYVDYDSGNWAEGLTSYLADHLIREQQGKGAAWRRDVLLKYANWVKEGRDTPLVRFRSRHGQASEAAGYGRMLMVTHMLRMRLGDQAFLRGLQRFYLENRFRIAGFDDLQHAFEESSGERLGEWFRQWTRRTGAPDLRLEAVTTTRKDSGYLLRGRLRQVQREAPFRLRIPIHVQVEGEESPRLYWQGMEGRELTFELALERRPLRLLVDPQFDLFRRLHPDEAPPTLGALFGANSLNLVLPRQAPEPWKEAYLALARRWQQTHPQIAILWDDDLQQLPEGAANWILGRENRFAGKVLEPLAGLGVSLSDGGVRLENRHHPIDGNSLVLAAPGATGLLILGSPQAGETLARKLPHYGKYSYLLFSGEESVNRLKGQWTTHATGLSALLTDRPLPPLRLPPHSPLAEALTGQESQAAR